jgi:hypothetical protein
VLEEDRETYLLSPGFAAQLSPEFFSVSNLYLAINRQEVLFIWPVKAPSADGRRNDWHVSAQIAAEKAMKEWVNVRPNMNLRAYETSLPEMRFPDPEWPTLAFRDILEIAFRDRIIHGPEHLVMQKLRGVI